MPFNTPEEAEDAYYDALEKGDLESLLSVWDQSDDIACSLPMSPLVMGRAQVEKTYDDVLSALRKIDLQIRHLAWIKSDNTAIHLAEELVMDAPPGQTPPPVYATNIYRKTADGWSLILHQNAPVPQPPGAAMGGPGGPSGEFPHLP